MMLLALVKNTKKALATKKTKGLLNQSLVKRCTAKEGVQVCHKNKAEHGMPAWGLNIWKDCMGAKSKK
jgi:hypothetical protein